MKIVTGRIINMLAVLILLFGHISASNATTFHFKKTDKTLKFSKLNLADDENSYLEDEEEEEEEEEKMSHPAGFSFFMSYDFESNIKPEFSEKKDAFHTFQQKTTTPLPLWLEVRHILI